MQGWIKLPKKRIKKKTEKETKEIFINPLPMSDSNSVDDILALIDNSIKRSKQIPEIIIEKCSC